MTLATGLIALSAALAVAMSAFGCGIAQGRCAGKAFEAIARQPEVAGTIRTLLFITLAFIETLTIYGLLIAFMLVAKI